MENPFRFIKLTGMLPILYYKSEWATERQAKELLLTYDTLLKALHLILADGEPERHLSWGSLLTGKTYTVRMTGDTVKAILDAIEQARKCQA